MALTQVKGSVLPDEQTLQPGMVMMWAGAENQIPTGWQLCNGEGTTSNGIEVPDMMDLMVIGSGSTYDTGDIGGAASGTTSSNGSHSHGVTVESGGGHSHTVTVDGTTLTESQMPSHGHKANSYGYGANDYSDRITANDNGGSTYVDAITISANGGSTPHNHTATTNSTGSHTHTASSASTGAHTHSVDTLSPYYALAFIIKL